MTATFPLGPFAPHASNPVLGPRGTTWESGSVYNPAALVVDGFEGADGQEVVLLYRAHADDVVSHVGLARSRDGVTFTCDPDPVLSPVEPHEVHGVEDPRVTEVDGTYYLTYSAYDGERALLCLATSTDLRTWERHGVVLPELNSFAGHEGGPTGPWTKAGGILPTKVDGRWLMYVGEGSVYLAESDDLLHWRLVSEQPVLAPEPGTWSEFLVEVGPPPVLLDNGLICLVYNAAVKLPEGGVRYVCGQALFDPADPTRLVAKLDQPWLEPRTAEEQHGLVSNVTFVEGLVQFQGSWFAYYGQSDSTLGVAVAPAGERFGATALPALSAESALPTRA